MYVKRFDFIMSILVSILAVIMIVKIFFFAMRARDFVTLVANMMRVQKAYFRNGRKYSDLIESRKLEQEVTQALKEGIDIPGEAVLDTIDGDGPDQGEQIGMFGE